MKTRMFLMGMGATALVLSVIGGFVALALFLTQSNRETAQLETQFSVQATKTAEEFRNLSATINERRTESTSNASALQAELSRKLEAQKQELANKQSAGIEAVQTQIAQLGSDVQKSDKELQKSDKELEESLKVTQGVVEKNTLALGHLENSNLDTKTLYQQARQAVVLITSPSGQGSGFLYGEKKDRVVTAFHVVESATSWETDILASNGIKTRARVEKKDKESDLAILELAIPLTELEPLELEDQQPPLAGEPIALIGNPSGLAGSIATGIVSNPASAMYGAVCQNRCPPFIQLDAATPGGYSGGPVLNRRGKVVGIASQKIDANIGFAIPAGRIAALMQTPSLPYPSETQTPVRIDFSDVPFPQEGEFRSPVVSTAWKRTFTISGQEVTWNTIRLQKLGSLPSTAFRGFAVLLDGEYVFGFRGVNFSGDSVLLYNDRGGASKLPPGSHTIEIKADIETGEGEFAFALGSSTDIGFSVPDIVTRDGRRLRSDVTITVSGEPFKFLAAVMQRVIR